MMYRVDKVVYEEGDEKSGSPRAPPNEARRVKQEPEDAAKKS